MNTRLTRRKFLARVAVGAGALCATRGAWGADTAKSRVIVVKGKDPARMLALGMEKLGGWGTFIKSGAKVVVKLNAAWAEAPETGANTSPAVVNACIEACRKAGAGQVLLPENPCSSAKESFPMSGIAQAVKQAGGKLYVPPEYRLTAIPKGKRLTEAAIAVDVLENDCLINLPVAKSHGGATLTLSMKNWMGSVKDRSYWHRNDLHQCIADFSTRISPNLVIIDAMRIMLTGGPHGPGKLAHPEQLIFSTDPVAADAYAATLFDRKPLDIRHIRLAEEAGIGCGDPARWEVESFEAA